MKRKHIITISGRPGSGKSTTADKVAELLGYTRHSSGDMVRQILFQNKMTLIEYNKKAEHDHSLDSAVDDKLRELRDWQDIVIDSRLGFYWIPESFKVYLDLDMEVATARIYKDATTNASRRNVGEASGSLADVITEIHKRIENEQRRFKAMYHVDPYGLENFDLIIDTSRHTPETVALTIFDVYRRWLQSETWKQEFSEIPIGYSFKNEY